MALTFTTGMTVDNTAQAITNIGWVPFVGTPDHGPTLITSHGAMGANCVGGAGNWILAENMALMYDYFTDHASVALDLTAVGNEVLAIWFHCADPGQAQTLINGGIYIIASSSVDVGNALPTAYRRWYVSGKDVFRNTAKGPWYLAMIDTRKAASVADVGVPSLAAIHRYGIGIIVGITQSVGGPPPENLFFGGAMHGRPIYQVIGDGALTATWNDIITHSLTTQQNGLIEDHGGAYKLSCGLRFGSATQVATTTFSDATSPTFVFKRSTYYLAGEVDALNYSDYYLVDAQGAASFKTSVTLGSVVGTADARQGVKGGAFLTSDQTNITYKADFSSANLSAANLYGTQWVGAKGGLKFEGSTVGLIITNKFQRSGEVDCGVTGNGATMLNSTIIDPEGATGNRSLTLRSAHNIKNMSFITSGTPATQHMLNLLTSGTYTVTMDNLQFFGDYSSATLWHGDLSSATLTTATGAASNGANPLATEFDKTGNASNTITILNTVTVKVTCLDAKALTVISGARVFLTADTGGPLPYQASVTITSSGTTATVTHTAHGRKTGEKMVIRGANQPEYNGIQSITVTTVNAYTYTITGTPATPATGTITSTMVILDGVSDVNGIVQDTGFNYPGSAQPVTGRARKSTTAPLYATAPIVGSITTAGATLSAFMVPD